jgi:hypothetical protein
MIRVCDGYKSVWNGNNYVAEFTDDALEADDYITEYLATKYDPGDQVVSVWDASDWFQNAPPDVPGTISDEELDIMAEELISDTDGVHVIEGIEGYLWDRREEARAE